MSAPKNHHHVPVFYLKEWAVDDGKLCVYSKKHNKFVVDKHIPKYTGYVRNLYSLKTAPEEKKQVVETDFFAKEIDDPASKVHQEILAAGSENINFLSIPQRRIWAKFLYSMGYRRPSVINAIRELARERAITALEVLNSDNLKSKGGSPSEQLSLSEIATNRFLSVHGSDIIEDEAIRNVLSSLICEERFIKIIMQMDWKLYDFSHIEIDLLTSDAPLIRGEYPIDHDYHTLFLPLSPTKLFSASKIIFLQSIKLDGENVKAANKDVVSHAEKYVYGSHKYHLPLVEKCLGLEFNKEQREYEKIRKAGGQERSRMIEKLKNEGRLPKT